MNIPEEKIGAATSLINETTTPEGGDKGILSNLNKILEDDPEIKL